MLVSAHSDPLPPSLDSVSPPADASPPLPGRRHRPVGPAARRAASQRDSSRETQTAYECSTRFHDSSRLQLEDQPVYIGNRTLIWQEAGHVHEREDGDVRTSRHSMQASRPRLWASSWVVDAGGPSPRFGDAYDCPLWGPPSSTVHDSCTARDWSTPDTSRTALRTYTCRTRVSRTGERLRGVGLGAPVAAL